MHVTLSATHRGLRGRRLFIASITLVVGVVAQLSAQDRLDPVTMGTGRSSIAVTRGIGALFVNPAGIDYLPLLGTTLPQDVVFSIYSPAGTIGGTYLKGEEFSQIFGGLEGASNEDREQIGTLLVDERLFANGGVNFLSGTWRLGGGSGTLGVHYGSRAYARINFPDDLANLIASSNIAQKDFRFVNRGIGATWLTEFGVTYGKVFGSQSGTGWLPSVGVGLTGKLIGGVGHFDVEENSALYIDQINVGGQLRFLVRGGYTFRSAEPDEFDKINAVSNFLSSPFPATSGLGVGFDLGISGILYASANRYIHYGFVLGNVGTVSWTNKARERRGVDFRDTLGASLSNREFEKFEGDLVPVESYATPLPTVFRAGIGMTLRPAEEGGAGGLTLGLEGEVPLNQVPGNTPDPRIGLGVDWNVAEPLSLRTGLNVGGIGDLGIGFGVGVKPVEWMSIDVGTSELNGLFTGDRLDFAARIAFGVTP